MADSLSTVNAGLNLLTSVLLIIGYRFIRNGRRNDHKKVMISAIVVSVLFLTSYIVYHSTVGSVPYPHYDWTRPLYFSFLIPHIVLAGLIVVPVIYGFTLALRGKFVRHRKLMKWIFPVWIYVSVSGLVVYIMLYRL